MPSFIEPVVENVGGQDISFPRLLLEDYATLEAKVRANRRAQIRQLLDECEVKGVDRFVALRNAEYINVPMADVDGFLFTHDGAKTAVTLSLKRGGQSQDQVAEVLSNLTIDAAVPLARELVGFFHRPTGEGAENHADVKE